MSQQIVDGFQIQNSAKLQQGILLFSHALIVKIDAGTTRAAAIDAMNISGEMATEDLRRLAGLR